MTLFRKIFSVASDIYIDFWTKMNGQFIGKDSDGNKYYQGKPRTGYKRPRRWVRYHGIAEASRVPPEWHGWLHHQTDAVPSENKNPYRRDWQKPHAPNKTGTREAYLPPGHLKAGGQRHSATGDYQAWQPPQ